MISIEIPTLVVDQTVCLLGIALSRKVYRSCQIAFYFMKLFEVLPQGRGWRQSRVTFSFSMARVRISL